MTYEALVTEQSVNLKQTTDFLNSMYCLHTYKYQLFKQPGTVLCTVATVSTGYHM